MNYFPEKFWQAVIAFLTARKTGKIILNIKEGEILKVEFRKTLSL